MRLKIPVKIMLLILLLSLMPLYGSRAQEPTPSDDEVNAIAKQLYCPVCDNVPLDVCPTKACEQWRGTIREKLALGWDEDQIKQYFVAQYGDSVLATPPARGLNWLVYILPPAAILIGAGVLFSAFRSWSRGTENANPPGEIQKEMIDDPYVARLEEELRKREGS
jgi:cytochrome c-type biogenesis protein CcmH